VHDSGKKLGSKIGASQNLGAREGVGSDPLRFDELIQILKPGYLKGPENIK